MFENIDVHGGLQLGRLGVAAEVIEEHVVTHAKPARIEGFAAVPETRPRRVAKFFFCVRGAWNSIRPGTSEIAFRLCAVTPPPCIHSGARDSMSVAAHAVIVIRVQVSIELVARERDATRPAALAHRGLISKYRSNVLCRIRRERAE
jgi:hypothetical protein